MDRKGSEGTGMDRTGREGIMFSTTLALVSIITGVEAPCPQSALHAAALELELLDERELRWFGIPGFEATELKILHERYVQLHDAPPACDAARFPSRDECSEAIAFNNAYIRFLEQRKTLFREDWIDEAIADAKRIVAIYDCVRDCRCEYYYITARREALQKLRSMLGAWNYYHATLPVVPVWHFRRID